MSRAGALAFKAMADLVKSVEVLVSAGFGELFSLPPCPVYMHSLEDRGVEKAIPPDLCQGWHSPPTCQSARYHRLQVEASSSLMPLP